MFPDWTMGDSSVVESLPKASYTFAAATALGPLRGADLTSAAFRQTLPNLIAPLLLSNIVAADTRRYLTHGHIESAGD